MDPVAFAGTTNCVAFPEASIGRPIETWVHDGPGPLGADWQGARLLALLHRLPGQPEEVPQAEGRPGQQLEYGAVGVRLVRSSTDVRRRGPGRNARVARSRKRSTGEGVGFRAAAT